MKGRRLNHGDGIEPQPGDYWPATSPRFEGYWTVVDPAGFQGMLNPNVHTVTEHEDGTITVHPSIVTQFAGVEKYHGWLRRGEWTDA